MRSFLILSLRVTPHIHRSILISVTSIRFSCLFVVAHVSAPYSIAGLITVLYEYRIRCASSWHKSKLAFMNFRALSDPSVDHLLPYFECVCEQFDASVILTLLNVTIFFEMGTRMLFRQADGMHSMAGLNGHDSVEKFAKFHHSQLSQAFPYLHWYLVAAHSLTTLHPSQCSLCFCLTDWARHALVGRSVLGLHSWVLFIHEPAEILTPSLSDLFIFH